MLKAINISLPGIGLLLVIVAFLYVAVLALVSLDLWAGIRKARKAGVYRSSKKLRRTLEKLVTYYNVLLIVTVIDVLVLFGVAVLEVNIPHFPYLTLLGALFVGVIELKSVFEKAEDKDRAAVADAVEDLRKLSKDKDLVGLLESMLAIAKSKEVPSHD